MATTTTSLLLQRAVPLVGTYGFTRTALAHAALHLPRPHADPLPDSAVSTLFGEGDDARRTLTHAWLDDARARMTEAPSLRDVLLGRLRTNTPVLAHLPEAFALLATGSALPLDPSPMLAHAARVADRACWLSEPHAKEMAWYTRRATVMGIYLAVELHQLTSPETAAGFLDELLAHSSAAEDALKEVAVYGSYILESWKGIARSRGLL